MLQAFRSSMLNHHISQIKSCDLFPLSEKVFGIIHILNYSAKHSEKHVLSGFGAFIIINKQFPCSISVYIKYSKVCLRNTSSESEASLCYYV